MFCSYNMDVFQGHFNGGQHLTFPTMPLMPQGIVGNVNWNPQCRATILFSHNALEHCFCILREIKMVLGAGFFFFLKGGPGQAGHILALYPLLGHWSPGNSPRMPITDTWPEAGPCLRNWLRKYMPFIQSVRLEPHASKFGKPSLSNLKKAVWYAEWIHMRRNFYSCCCLRVTHKRISDFPQDCPHLFE